MIKALSHDQALPWEKIKRLLSMQRYQGDQKAGILEIRCGSVVFRVGLCESNSMRAGTFICLNHCCIFRSAWHIVGH